MSMIRRFQLRIVPLREVEPEVPAAALLAPERGRGDQAVRR